MKILHTLAVKMKDYLAVLVSVIAIGGAFSAYVSRLAIAADVEQSNKTIIQKHETDIKHLERKIEGIDKKIDSNEKQRKKDGLLGSATDYTDKIHELQIKPNKSSYDLNMIDYYRDKKQDIETKISSS